MRVWECQIVEAVYLWALRYTAWQHSLRVEPRSDGGRYRSSITATGRKIEKTGSVRITPSLALKLARFSLDKWGESMLAREMPDWKPYRDVVAPTMTMFTRVPSDAARVVDDPVEAEFLFLQVETMLGAFENPTGRLRLSPDELAIIAELQAGLTHVDIANRQNVPGALVKRWSVDLSRRIEAHRRRSEATIHPGPSLERLFCFHRYVRLKATATFPKGRAIEAALERSLALQVRETWGASIPLSSIREVNEHNIERRREAKAEYERERRLRRSIEARAPEPEDILSLASAFGVQLEDHEVDERFQGHVPARLRGR